MAIIIPTGEFCGLLRDVSPFAFPETDLPDVNVVRLEWDGTMLHASATDTLRAARSSWHPHDDQAGIDKQPAMFNPYGGADPRWVVAIALADAAELVKIYKLPAKEGFSPLELDWDGRVLKVIRSRDTGHQAVTTKVEPRMVDFPDLSKALDGEVAVKPVRDIHYIGRHLTDLGQVRQRGQLRMQFAGPRAATRVTIGDRFVATLRPDLAADGQPLRERDGMLAAGGAEVDV